jgi:hypothetical protein
MCTVGLAGNENTSDVADFVEYLYGDAASHWGGVRVADGHPLPYRPVAIEISNEACMASFNGTFAPKIAGPFHRHHFFTSQTKLYSLSKANLHRWRGRSLLWTGLHWLTMSTLLRVVLPCAAMEARARLYGMGGRLRYVTGSYLGITAASSHCPGSPDTTYQVFEEVAAAGLCGQLYVDTHISPPTTMESGAVSGPRSCLPFKYLNSSQECL